MDICQSILASFLRRAREGGFELGAPDGLRNLLVTMALNKLMTKARAAQREAGNLPEGWDAADPAPAPAERLAAADLARAALERLSEEDRSLFRLHEVDQLTWEEIARRRGSSPDALRIRLARALARVRHQLSPEA
jgi:RNA polymerase sigma-70 factor (ECF subfamily)